jgi:hypothetical protein
MWVYDGENWTDEEDDEKSTVRPEPRRPPYDALLPELQVVEITPATSNNRTNRMPPFPRP